MPTVCCGKTETATYLHCVMDCTHTSPKQQHIKKKYECSWYAAGPSEVKQPCLTWTSLLTDVSASVLLTAIILKGV